MTMLERLQKVQEILNGPEAAKFCDYYSAEHYNGYITLKEDDDIGYLKITAGHIDEVGLGDAPEGAVVIGAGGPARIWDHVKDAYQRSIQTVNVNFKDDPSWGVVGPKLLNRQFNTTLSHVCRIYSYVRDNDEIYCDAPPREPSLPVDTDFSYVRGFYINVKGYKTYVETNDGPTDKGIIIALHTAGRECRQYHDLMKIFKDKYRIYAPDMPGHGKSMPYANNTVIMNNEMYIAWIWDVTCALGVERPIYIGCSMAGGIVYYMAAEHPDAVRAVVCMQGNDDTAVGDPSGMIPLLTHPANNVSVSQRDFSDSMIGRKTAQSRVDFIRWGVATETSILKRGDFGCCYFLDIKDRMPEVKCPVRIIEGTDDTIYTVKMAEGTMERLVNCPDKKLVAVEGYGHFIAVESPENVAVVIDDLIQSLDD
ncbi:MAG: alpha/beta hydrolase [Anaerolineaceae bacterium]|nr:alpha/beta hydrolase [Anaerolineaceae bacterium]